MNHKRSLKYKKKKSLKFKKKYNDGTNDGEYYYNYRGEFKSNSEYSISNVVIQGFFKAGFDNYNDKLHKILFSNKKEIINGLRDIDAQILHDEENNETEVMRNLHKYIKIYRNPVEFEIFTTH